MGLACARLVRPSVRHQAWMASCGSYSRTLSSGCSIKKKRRYSPTCMLSRIRLLIHPHPCILPGLNSSSSSGSRGVRSDLWPCPCPSGPPPHHVDEFPCSVVDEVSRRSTIDEVSFRSALHLGVKALEPRASPRLYRSDASPFLATASPCDELLLPAICGPGGLIRRQCKMQDKGRLGLAEVGLLSRQ
jgi:hypothetical protein